MPIGETLTKARQRHGLSVEDVSEATRIRQTIVRAIEADDFAPCGGSVYARGHIRSIAHVVGIDPEPLIEEYDGTHGGPPGGPAPLPVTPFDPETDVSSPRRGPNWTAAAVVMLLVIIGVAAYALVANHKTTGTGGTLAVPPASTSPTPAAASQTPTAASTPPAVAAINPNVVTIELRVLHDTTWLSVQNAAGSSLFQGLVSAGQSKQFTDPHGLSLVIGNAPVVDLIVNGHDLGAPPSTGNVYRHTFGPGDPTGQGGAG